MKVSKQLESLLRQATSFHGLTIPGLGHICQPNANINELALFNDAAPIYAPMTYKGLSSLLSRPRFPSPK